MEYALTSRQQPWAIVGAVRRQKTLAEGGSAIGVLRKVNLHGAIGKLTPPSIVAELRVCDSSFIPEHVIHAGKGYEGLTRNVVITRVETLRQEACPTSTDNGNCLFDLTGVVLHDDPERNRLEIELTEYSAFVPYQSGIIPKSAAELFAPEPAITPDLTAEPAELVAV